MIKWNALVIAGNYNTARDSRGSIEMKDMLDHGLDLTQEEAMGLLDIVLMCPLELTMEQRAALDKLSEFCRVYIRENVEANCSVSPAFAA